MDTVIIKTAHYYCERCARELGKGAPEYWDMRVCERCNGKKQPTRDLAGVYYE